MTPSTVVLPRTQRSNHRQRFLPQWVFLLCWSCVVSTIFPPQLLFGCQHWGENLPTKLPPAASKLTFFPGEHLNESQLAEKVVESTSQAAFTPEAIGICYATRSYTKSIGRRVLTVRCVERHALLRRAKMLSVSSEKSLDIVVRQILMLNAQVKINRSSQVKLVILTC